MIEREVGGSTLHLYIYIYSLRGKYTHIHYRQLGDKFKEEPTKSSFTCILAQIQQVYRNSAGEANTCKNRTRFLEREATLIDKGTFNV